jgi:hypothetical protein
MNTEGGNMNEDWDCVSDRKTWIYDYDDFLCGEVSGISRRSSEMGICFYVPVE